MLEAAFASAVGNALRIVVTFMIGGEALLLVGIVEIVLKAVTRGGSVCLNSFGRFAKWISASIMLPPSSVSAR